MNPTSDVRRKIRMCIKDSIAFYFGLLLHILGVSTKEFNDNCSFLRVIKCVQIVGNKIDENLVQGTRSAGRLSLIKKNPDLNNLSQKLFK